MAVSVNMPTRKQEKESALDKVLRGVQIAQSVYGIYSDYQGNQANEEKLGILKAAETDRQSGVLDASQVLQHGDNYKFSDESKPGSIPFQMHSPEGIKTQFATPKDKSSESPLAAEIQRLNVKKLNGDIENNALNRSSPQASFDRLPEENKNAIKTLSTKNANKVAIATQIDSVLSKLEDPQVPQDMKLALGQGLIKTLNSTEGSDAVGAEEVKRLAPYLSPQYLRAAWGPGKALGTDIPSFLEQVKLTSDSLKQSVQSNNGLIDKLKTGGKLEIERNPEYVNMSKKDKGEAGGSPLQLASKTPAKMKVQAGNVALEGSPEEILKQIREAKIRKNGIKGIVR